VTCSTKIRLRKATTITGMYAALDLGQKTVRAVLKRQDGKIVNELKIKKQADSVPKFLKGTHVVHMFVANGTYLLYQMWQKNNKVVRDLVCSR
jgi:hypothetical protein